MNIIPESKRWTRKFTAPFRAVKAGLLGYFWLPCPLCGEKFAGFEWGESLPTHIGGGQGVCPMEGCCTEARRRTKEFYERPEVVEQMTLAYSQMYPEPFPQRGVDRQELRTRLLKSSRFTVLRMKRGLPFKSRRQP